VQLLCADSILAAAVQGGYKKQQLHEVLCGRFLHRMLCGGKACCSSKQMSQIAAVSSV